MSFSMEKLARFELHARYYRLGQLLSQTPEIPPQYIGNKQIIDTAQKITEELESTKDIWHPDLRCIIDGVVGLLREAVATDNGEIYTTHNQTAGILMLMLASTLICDSGSEIEAFNQNVCDFCEVAPTNPPNGVTELGLRRMKMELAKISTIISHVPDLYPKRMKEVIDAVPEDSSWPVLVEALHTVAAEYNRVVH